MGGHKADTSVAVNQLQRVKASNAVINRQLIEMNGGGVASAADVKRARKVARDRMKRLSTKSKNKRRPPDRWGKQKISPVDSKEEKEKEADEGDESDEQEEDNSDEEETDYDAMHVDESEEDGEDDYDMEL